MIQQEACDNINKPNRGKMAYLVVVLIVAFFSVFWLFAGGCAKKGGEVRKPEDARRIEPMTKAKRVVENKLVVFNAANLNSALRDVDREFKQINPGVDVIREASGSQTVCRKVTELKREADVLPLADFEVIEKLLMPKWTDWYLIFATNSIVIVYTDHSKYGDKIDSNNWYKILLKEDVNYGYAEPNLAPVGYRTLLTWQLADLYYKKKIGGKSISQALLEGCPKRNIRPDVEELIPLLESLALDYAFVYESVAKEHNLKYIRLPDEINLSNPEFANFYKKASVKITGKKKNEIITMIGKPILQGVTILKDAPHPNLAKEYVKLLISKGGQQILDKWGQEPIVPPIANDLTKVPQELRGMVKEKAQ